MASIAYNRHRYRLANGDFRPATAVLRAMLTTSGYTPNKDHNTLSDITNEISTGAYSRQTISGLNATEDDAGDQAVVDGTDPAFTGVGNGTQTAAWLIIFERLAGADAGTDPLVVALDIADTLTVGDTLVTQFASQGIFAAT